jgi:polysaccharide biosynthesis protein PslG
MARFIHFVLLCALLASLVPSPVGAAPHSPSEVPISLQTGSARTFGETGFTVANHFLSTWDAAANPLFVYGLPISQPFIEESISTTGEYYRVQYFERAVLEENPDLAGTSYYVQGRLLGTASVAVRRTEPAFVPVADPGDGTYDRVSRHTLRDSPAPFRDFYLRNGGLRVYGRPLSEQTQEVNKADGKTYWVQYFERQRLEWHPDEADPRFRILLGLLGSEYRDAQHTGAPAFDPTATVTTHTASSDPGAVNPLPGFVYGFNAVLYGAGYGTTWQDRPRLMNLAMQAGMPWIRQQVRWMDLHDKSGVIYWGELDHIVADAQKRQTQLLLSIVAAPRWTTANGLHGMPARAHYATFNTFVEQMAHRYAGKVRAYQIWNEQNLAVENGGTVSGVADYMDLLVGAARAIKAADPQAIVVSGALASTETNWPTVA